MKVRIGPNPTFDSVTGLTNRSFDAGNITEGQMVTEDQLLSVYERIVEDEKRADACCRDIVFWEARTQIVRMNTNTFNTWGYLNGGGIVVSTFDENVNFGSARRGVAYTVTFPVKWDSGLYVSRNAAAAGIDNGFHYNEHDATNNNKNWSTVNYRIIEDNSHINICNAVAASNKISGFWLGLGESLSSTGVNNNRNGHRINTGGNWVLFGYNVLNDGTVKITDNRMNTNFNVIRFYTQWILRETADGQTIPDPE